MTAHRKEMDAVLVQSRHAYWFVHVHRWSAEPLCFIRDNRNGALVVGADTGPERTKHGESWWDKLCELGGRGYVPIEVAGPSVVPYDWSPPELSEKDAYLIERIEKGDS